MIDVFGIQDQELFGCGAKTNGDAGYAVAHLNRVEPHGGA